MAIDMSETPVHHANCLMRGIVCGRVMTDVKRSRFRLVMNNGRIMAGWIGSWDGFIEHAQSTAPCWLKFNYVDAGDRQGAVSQ